MNIQIRKYTAAELSLMVYIWNEVVEEGIAFPQMEPLNDKSGLELF